MSKRDPATVAALREEFLDLIGECILDIDYDADTTSTGHPIDCSSFTISGKLDKLEYFLEALGVERGIFECWDEAIHRVLTGLRQPDRCEMPNCGRHGIRGNENIVDGRRMCDYCHFDYLEAQEAQNEPCPTCGTHDCTYGCLPNESGASIF